MLLMKDRSFLYELGVYLIYGKVGERSSLNTVSAKSIEKITVFKGQCCHCGGGRSRIRAVCARRIKKTTVVNIITVPSMEESGPEFTPSLPREKRRQQMFI